MGGSRYREHEKLLFRWVGRDIEGGENASPSGYLRPLKLGTLNQDQRDLYLERVKEALDPKKGLYAQVPDEVLGPAKTHWRPNLPCLCFTELSLSSTLDHCRIYGRLGFGFSKKAILEMSGRPVAYIPGNGRDPTFKQLYALRKAIGSLDQPKLQAALDYLMHFYKRLQFPAPQYDPDQVKSEVGNVRKVIPKPTLKATRIPSSRWPKVRPFPYLEEQEWRIAISRERSFETANPPGKKHSLWYPIKPGDQLLVLVVPDNQLLQAIVGTESLRQRIFQPAGRPVQIISYEAVGRL